MATSRLLEIEVGSAHVPTDFDTLGEAFSSAHAKPKSLYGQEMKRTGRKMKHQPHMVVYVEVVSLHFFSSKLTA
jgi:hypothetical protein